MRDKVCSAGLDPCLFKILIYGSWTTFCINFNFFIYCRNMVLNLES